MDESQVAERTDCVTCGGPLGRPRGDDGECFACVRFTISELQISPFDDLDYQVVEDMHDYYCDLGGEG